MTVTMLLRPSPVALGHGVSAQQGVLKVAHSDTLGRLRPRSRCGGSGEINLLTYSNLFNISEANIVRATHNKCGECGAVQVSSLLNGKKGKKGHAPAQWP